MTSTKSPKSTGQILVIVVVAAILIAVVSTVVQNLVLGKSNVAVTGGVVGAMVALLVVSNMKKKSDS